MSNSWYFRKVEGYYSDYVLNSDICLYTVLNPQNRNKIKREEISLTAISRDIAIQILTPVNEIFSSYKAYLNQLPLYSTTVSHNPVIYEYSPEIFYKVHQRQIKRIKKDLRK